MMRYELSNNAIIVNKNNLRCPIILQRKRNARMDEYNN